MYLSVFLRDQDEIEKEKGPNESGESNEGKKSNTCEECGATFKKPAYLKQHMQSHSLEVYIHVEICGKYNSVRFYGYR